MGFILRMHIWKLWICIIFPALPSHIHTHALKPLAKIQNHLKLIHGSQTEFHVPTSGNM